MADLNDTPTLALLTNTSFSGSTLFSLVADAHPQIVALGDGLNPDVMQRRSETYECTCGQLIMNCEFWAAVLKSLQADGFAITMNDCNMRYSFSHPVPDRLLGRYYSDYFRKSLRRVLQRLYPPYSEFVRQQTRLNIAFARSVLKQSGKSVYIHNTKPLLMLEHLRGIKEFRVRIICLTRDVRGYTYSATKRGRSIAVAAKRWKLYHANVVEILKELPREKICYVKYEDFCQNPADAMRPLFSFLEVRPYEPAATVLTKRHHVTGNDMRLKPSFTIRADMKWKDAFSEANLDLIREIAGSTNDDLGYVW